MEAMERELVIMLGIIALVLGLIVWGVVELSYKSCTSQAAIMGFKVKWGYVSGCMIHTPQGWVQMENYRVFKGE